MTPGRYERDSPVIGLERKAYERHVLELVRGYVRLSDAYSHEFSDIELEGEYPDTVIRLRCIRRRTGEDYIYHHQFWRDDSFRTESGNMYSPERIASDILMLADGG